MRAFTFKSVAKNIRYETFSGGVESIGIADDHAGEERKRSETDGLPWKRVRRVSEYAGVAYGHGNRIGKAVGIHTSLAKILIDPGEMIISRCGEEEAE